MKHAIRVCLVVFTFICLLWKHPAYLARFKAEIHFICNVIFSKHICLVEFLPLFCCCFSEVYFSWPKRNRTTGGGDIYARFFKSTSWIFCVCCFLHNIIIMMTKYYTFFFIFIKRCCACVSLILPEIIMFIALIVIIDWLLNK